MLMFYRRPFSASRQSCGTLLRLSQADLGKSPPDRCHILHQRQELSTLPTIKQLLRHTSPKIARNRINGVPERKCAGKADRKRNQDL